MKKALIHLILILCAASLLAQQQGSSSPRYKITINDDWSFSKGANKPAEDNGWTQVDLPHSWNTKDPFEEERGYYRGVGWYRKRLNTNNLPNKEKAFIYFEAANQNAQVIVNALQIERLLN
jgi:beta-galactosidase